MIPCFVLLYLGGQIQMDLVNMGKYKRDNGILYWILTAINKDKVDMPIRSTVRTQIK